MSRSVFFIAGEHSADALGGRLIAAMKAQEPGVSVSGVGGPMMAAQGLASLHPMEDLCVMGLVEVLKHYPRLRRLGFEIIEEIERTQPDVVVTIDLPDFNFRVAKLLKKRGVYQGTIIHYVAPSVWAWRPGRAKKIAQFLDGLMCLFPFEPPYFEAHGLRTEFVGHSMVETDILSGDGAAFRARHGIGPEQKTLGVLFGSRVREFETHSDVFIEAVQRLGDVHVIVPTLPRLAGRIEAALSAAGVSYTLITQGHEKWDAFVACGAAIAVSGTVGLELAYAGVPHVIGYKAHPLTAWLIRRLIRVRFAHLANILMDRAVVPEFLQEQCRAEVMAPAVEELLADSSAQRDDFEALRMMLAGEGRGPSERAAGFVLLF